MQIDFHARFATLIFCFGTLIAAPSPIFAVTIEGSYVQAYRLANFSPTGRPVHFGSALSVSGDSYLVAVAGYAGFMHLEREPIDLSPQGYAEDNEPFVDANAYLSCNSVATDGQTMVVGRPSANDFRGSVVIYVRSEGGTGWTPTQTLFDATGAPWDEFGCAVAMSGDRIVVGAPGAGASGSGFLFKHRLGSWQLTDRLLPMDRAANDRIGAAVAIDAELVALGAPRKDAASAGAAYVFAPDHSGVFAEQRKFTGDGMSTGDLFGASLAVAGNLLVVGAPDSRSQEGSAYVYGRDKSGSWTLVKKLLSATPVREGYFGSAVALTGDRIVVGEIGNAATHIFGLTDEGWNERAVIGAGSTTRFGGRVATTTDLVTVTAYAEETFGVIYLFSDDTVFMSGF